MTPAARYQAAIEVLDRVLAGMPAEQALTSWARASRFAGSGDRAAVRDHVYDALRRRRSAAALGGGLTGRGLVLGLLRGQGVDPGAVFGQVGHAPAALEPGEGEGHAPVAGPEAADLPDWLWPLWCDSLGAHAQAAAESLRHRAPVFLRANAARIGRDDLAILLARDGIATRPHPLSPGALEVTEGARRVHLSAPYRNGLAEVQDAASQAVVDALPLRAGLRVLDFCAGGGGKALAMAARAGVRVLAHDAAAARMRDLPVRAARGGHDIAVIADPRAQAPYDVVLCDVPCSGSGAWRRSPEGKWLLTPARLEELVAIQAEILDRCAGLVGRDGVLAFATCSVLACENAAQVDRFLETHPGWICRYSRAIALEQGADGFFTAHFSRQ